MKFSVTRTLLIVFLLYHSLVSNGQVYYNAEEAFATAVRTNKTLLLVFAGSDWCLPCIRFHKNILSDSSFVQLTSERLIFLKAEFLQREKQPLQLRKQNELLAEQYNPKGLFPHILLLNPNKTILGTLTYANQSPKEFLKQINSYLNNTAMLQDMRREARLMGSAFEFIINYDTEKLNGTQLLDESIQEVKRIETLLTEFDESSQTSQLNRMAGDQPVVVDKEVYDLIKRSLQISKITQGAFDISAGVLKKMYNFKSRNCSFPHPETIQQTIEKVGYKKILLANPDKVFLSQKGMHIGFGAIGKGYAADKVKAMLIKKGVTGGVVNASGDLTAWGKRADGAPWKVGIVDPGDPDKMLLWLPVNNASVATSGNYEQYFELEGVRYSHLINPKTGCPVTGIKSVSVVSPSAELSDALATAVFIMGVQPGVYFIDQLPQVHCLIVDDTDRIHYSSKLQIHNTDKLYV